jgi:2-polyprenyl-3-methyl-5-hydroxy-6-metoxy-1,4-benzoquinol methylase
MNYKKKLNKVYTLQFKFVSEYWKKRLIPKGQILYHKKNFSKYFGLPIKDFKTKRILETGAGPGVHATILALMCSEVHASDILTSNVMRMKILKKLYKLNNLKISQHDFRKTYNKSKNFDLISCHNWIQHSPNPGSILKKLVKRLKIGGRIYISCYHSGTFRFFITQIARSVLKFNDFELLKSRTSKFFPKGFKIYKNPDDIYSANIRDDFFTPYCITINYSNLLRLAKKYNLKLYTKIPKINKLIYKDNIALRVGLEKISVKNKFIKTDIFTRPVNEFKKSSSKIRNECVNLSKKIITNFNRRSSPLQRVNFGLNLYKIRSQYSHSNTNQKYKELKNFLTSFENYN